MICTHCHRAISEGSIMYCNPCAEKLTTEIEKSYNRRYSVGDLICFLFIVFFIAFFLFIGFAI